MRSFISRFWSKVAKAGPGNCWLWKGSHVKSGYGRFAMSHEKTVRAHRLAYELCKGEIPDGLCVCHSCDTRNCVNPAHLWLGTVDDNNQDMTKKGRQVSGLIKHPEKACRGEDQHLARLTDSKVRAIRQLKMQGLSLAELGRNFGVRPGTIRFVVTGQTWKHVK